MERKDVTGKDITRMNGLLPPTRRLPVCNAITSSDKKKEKKWSLGGILRRISSMRDSDSSSNDEEIVYCKRESKNSRLKKQSDNIVFHPLRNNLEYYHTGSNSTLPITESNMQQSVESLCVHRDSVHSRSSDGSLDGLGKKIKRNKVKARAEAKRDKLCPNSSSDEESRICNTSLTKFQSDDHSQNLQKNNSYSKKTRAARTERYIKRLSKDEGNTDNVNHTNHKRNNSEHFEERNEYLRASTYLRHSDSQRLSTLNGRNFELGIPDASELIEYPHKYITDMNQNNSYEKNGIFHHSDQNESNVLSRNVNYQSLPRSSNPPDPPPRRVFSYNCHSFPFNGRNQRNTKIDCIRRNEINEEEIHEWTRTGVAREEPQYATPLNSRSSHCYSRQYTNNRHQLPSNRDEEEASTCLRKNNRNNRLNCNFTDYNYQTKQIELSNTREENAYERISSNVFSTAKSSCRPDISNDDVVANERSMAEEEAVDRRRSSKNLEEAISELEAIYNSLRLGDEELLDRAERRSMEEYTLKHGKLEDKRISVDTTDSVDRTKDDMAYRRMHPVERPASLSEIIGQSSLPNISYLIASPVLSRKDYVDYPTVRSGRKDEPDITRDDVVFRNIHRANNTLKVIEPQPPFGIPLGPVSTATESDYLHTVPTKCNQPRSCYIPLEEPDVVTDDLAFRTLRKDAKNNMDNQSFKELPAKKKRAVRSLSANLYGLINHDRIHLHRQPSLREINDNVELPADNLNSYRRVVSDGELSDQSSVLPYYDEKPILKDINGNHSDSNACRKMIRVYVSPATTMKKSEKEFSLKENEPNKLRSTSFDNIWQEYSKTEYEPPLNENQNTDFDFVAYSRLCQDLVNIIKGSENEDDKRNNEKSEDDGVFSGQVEFVTEDPDQKDHLVESMLVETKIVVQEEKKEKEDDDDGLDYYLRLANENVKMIAEAISSVADHVRDSLEIQDDSSDRLTHESSIRSSSLLCETDRSSSKNEEAAELLNHNNKNLKNDDEYDMEVHLNRAVKDLQIAAASLCDSVQEIEQLEEKLGKSVESEKKREKLETEKENIEKESKVEEEKEKDVVPMESSVHEKKELKIDRGATRELSDAVCEGESNDECDIDSRTVYNEYGNLFAKKCVDMRVPYVTNIITITITEYSMVLLACLLALLLAIVAVS